MRECQKRCTTIWRFAFLVAMVLALVEILSKSLLSCYCHLQVVIIPILYTWSISSQVLEMGFNVVSLLCAVTLVIHVINGLWNTYLIRALYFPHSIWANRITLNVFKEFFILDKILLRPRWLSIMSLSNLSPVGHLMK